MKPVVAASNEPAFIKNLHITGFVQNTTSTWVNSSAIEYVFSATQPPYPDPGRYAALYSPFLAAVA